MRARLRLAGIGLAGALVGLAGVLLVAPGLLGPAAPMLRDVLSTELATSRLAVSAVGVVVALGGVLASNAGRAVTDPVRPDLEPLLGGLDSTVAGAALSERLGRFGDLDATERETERDQLRTDLRETARTVLLQTESWSEAAVTRRLDEGTWTDDPGAAALFAAAPAPLTVRLREWLGPRTAFERRVDRVLEVLERRLALEPSGPESASGAGEDRRDVRVDANQHRLPAVDSPEGDEGTEDRRSDSTTIRFDPDATPTVSAQHFGLGVGFVAVSVGLLTGATLPFLIGLFGVGFAVSKQVSGAPTPELELTRTIASDNPYPGDRVDVRLTVENGSSQSVADLRVIDGPPEPLEVVDGSPSLFTSLQPGASDTLDYTIRAKRGTYSFGDATVSTRSVTGTRERSLAAAVPTRISCTTLLADLPLLEQNSNRIGTVKTDRGGSGIEFYGTRDYRHGDPLSRVNWKQLAKTGELTTVEFREQRAPTVAIVLDQRNAARLAPSASELDGVDLSVYGAEQAFLTLLDQGMEVGLVTYADRITEIEPASDPTQRALVQSWLRAATDRYAAALGESDIESESAVLQRQTASVELLEHHIPRNAQVLVLSPATDAFAVDATERLSSLGHQVTLLSPDVTSGGDIGRRRARLDRVCRLDTIRDRGVRVVDWQPDEALEIALTRAIDHYG